MEYAIVAGNDYGLFAVDPWNGVISMVTNLSPDTWKTTVFQLQVTANDMAVAPQQQLTCTTLV